jgi:hypothetical protein
MCYAIYKQTQLSRHALLIKKRLHLFTLFSYEKGNDRNNIYLNRAFVSLEISFFGNGLACLIKTEKNNNGHFILISY